MFGNRQCEMKLSIILYGHTVTDSPVQTSIFSSGTKYILHGYRIVYGLPAKL